MTYNSIASIILAAGYSSRMGDFKPLLKIGPYIAIEHAIRCFQQAGISNIKVVVGFKSQEIIEAIKHLDVDIIVNCEYQHGMYTSVIAGVRALEREIERFFILPSDLPLINHTIIKRILDFESNNPFGIIYPTFNLERGHPPLIDAKYKLDILSGCKTGGLRDVLASYEQEAYDLEVEDVAVLLDMDTQDDYERIKRIFEKRSLDLGSSWQILTEARLDEKIEKHCFAVACTALDIVTKLNDMGAKLDEELVLVGALLHDIIRNEPNHAKIAGRLLSEQGYPQIAKIVGAHMDIEIDENQALTEAEIVYYADKMINGKTLTSIKDRFDKTLHKYKANPHICNVVLKRLRQAEKIERKIKSAVGYYGENTLDSSFYLYKMC